MKHLIHSVDESSADMEENAESIGKTVVQVYIRGLLSLLSVFLWNTVTSSGILWGGIWRK